MMRRQPGESRSLTDTAGPGDRSSCPWLGFEEVPVAIPTRDQAIVTLDEGQAALDSLFARLSDEEMTRPATIGGEWSAKHLLGHVAFWEELALEALTDWRAGRRPSVECIFEGGREGIDAANARDQERTAAQSLSEVRARATTAHTTLVQSIREMSDEEWRGKSPYPNAHRVTFAELIGSVLGAPKRPFGHAFAHLPDLQAYVESLGDR